MSLWTATPHQNPPLDLTELEGVSSFQPVPVSVHPLSYLPAIATLADKSNKQTKNHLPFRLKSSIQRCRIIGHSTKQEATAAHITHPIRPKNTLNCSRSVRATFSTIRYEAHTSAAMIWLGMFPAVALVMTLILGVIVVLLKWGPEICGVRHHTLADEREWEETRAYDHGISYA